MMRHFKIVLAALLTGTFLVSVPPPAHAIFGIRAARAALAARRAEKAMNSSEDKNGDAEQNKVPDTNSQAPAFESENPNIEKLRQMEAESQRT